MKVGKADALDYRSLEKVKGSDDKSSSIYSVFPARDIQKTRRYVRVDRER